MINAERETGPDIACQRPSPGLLQLAVNDPPVRNALDSGHQVNHS
jgi:hypothetical protein